MSLSAIRPLTTWGDTFSNSVGAGASLASGTVSGIDYDTLNRRRFSNAPSFNEFYGSVKDFIMARLGHPVVRVELTDFQIMTAIDEAVSKLDYHAPDWCSQMATFVAEPNISMYELPKHVINNLQYVAYKKTLLSIAAANNSLEFDFFLKYFQDNFLFNDFAVSDFLIMKMHLEQIRKILGREGTYSVLNNQYVILYPMPREREEVIVEYKALDIDRLHHYFINWIQRFALAISKGILAQIRGKYSMLPSPGGGAQLNGAQLAQEAEAEKQQLIETLMTEIEEPPAFTMF
jgi:hypothetical protein